MIFPRSWVESANSATTDFPLPNLPCGVFSTGPEEPRCGVAIGDMILDITALEAERIFCLSDMPLFDVPYWNELMEQGPAVWARFRARLTEMLAEGAAEQAQLEPHLVPIEAARLHLPFLVSEFTDFYSGKHHASNVGTMFRGAENALPPNWLSMPIGYNGRASSVVVSGTDVVRPWGQIKAGDADLPVFAPSQRFDLELELGAVVGRASEGMLSADEADDNIFGYVLLNDWSARDIQAWEYVPLGPFQGKAVATTISPWIVMKPALEPFRCETPERERPLLPYLRERRPLSYDIALEVALRPAGGGETVISRTSTRELYYSPAQQLCHHASSGCPMNAGDLLGSGTISGPGREECGSLLEISWGGERPLDLPDGSTRRFLEDGDTVVLRGHAAGEGFRIGFGACAGTVLPARPLPDWAS